MRRILVDSARARRAEKRGGQIERIPIKDNLIGQQANELDLIALHQVLGSLSMLGERNSKGVELRFFGGLGA